MSAQLWLDLVVGLVVLVGLVGAVIQVIPGSTLVGASVLVWGLVTRGGPGWTVAAIALVVTVGAQVVKYLVAGRFLKARGVPNGSLLVGGALGVVGFFVIPVVGLVVGFVGGTYLAEWYRLRAHRPAWRATVAALQATGLTILVELFAALVVALAWGVAAIAVGVGADA
ncbi:MAG: DUF456 domain-containing protein [Cellulomonas sp.]|nr:DUF456 domain-containing protein [Cellulomonas sp.]